MEDVKRVVLKRRAELKHRLSKLVVKTEVIRKLWSCTGQILYPTGFEGIVGRSCCVERILKLVAN